MDIAVDRRASWREVEPEFAVGEIDGNFAGTIEHRGGEYLATTGLGEALGAFASASEAQVALERAAERAGVREYGRRDVALSKIMAVAASFAALAVTTSSLAALVVH
ncbi:hypothetical protein [Arenivirga flava]|nr:hypothetical protein [Arenivirga flava]